MTAWPKFESIDEWSTKGKKCFVVHNQTKCRDWTHLINNQVLIDGVAWKVAGVESKGCGPWFAGEPISLMVIP